MSNHRMNIIKNNGENKLVGIVLENKNGQGIGVIRLEGRANDLRWVRLTDSEWQTIWDKYVGSR